MRFIDLDKLLRKRYRWGNRKELWKNKNLQKDFRDASLKKCWYTEVQLIGQDVHIDHFRPKKAVMPFEAYKYNEPLESTGYYWLINDPKNYRASCIYANRITGEGGKGNYFPLADESPLMTENGEEHEVPLLLDPCKKEDVAQISFMGNRVVSISTDGFNLTRVRVSETIYNLKDSYIAAERAKIWMNVEKVLAEYQSGEIGRASCLRQLKNAVAREAPFSACAIACVNSLAPEEIKEELDLEL